METLLDRVVLLLILSDVAFLGLARVRSGLALLSLQAVLLSVLATASHSGALTPRVLGIAATGLVVRGILLPLLLHRASREAGVEEEKHPLVGRAASLLLGLAMLGAAMALGARLRLRMAPSLDLVVPAALFTVLTGVFLIVARRKALTQCLGYLVLENGIYGFGMTAVGDVPALVELGVLLDAFVAVLVMAVAIYHIQEEFEHLDTDQLDTLKG